MPLHGPQAKGGPKVLDAAAVADSKTIERQRPQHHPVCAGANH